MIKKDKIYAVIFLAISLLFSSHVLAVDLFDFEDDKNVIWKSGLNRYIQYAKQDSAKFGPNEHPVTLTETDLKFALSALEVPDDSFFSVDGSTKTVFSVQQIKLLSQQLPKGLKNAKPNEDIIFTLEKNQRQLLGLEDQRFISGRIFFKEGKLNIIIGEYDFFRSKAFESQYDPSGQGAIPYNLSNGERTRPSKAFEGVFVSVPGIENKAVNQLRHDWFLIDVKLAARAYVNNERANDPETKQSKQLEEEAARMAKQRREMRAEMARLRKEMRERGENSSPAPKANDKSIEGRFTTLDRLLEKELISKEEYDNKREEILNDI